MVINGAMGIGFRAIQTLGTPENRTGTVGPHLFEKTYTFTNGTAAGEADLCWSDRRTVAASATDTIDLSGGGLKSLGSSVNFAKVTGVIIRNRSTTAGDILHVGPALSNPFLGPWVDASDMNVIGPEGVAVFQNDTGWTVTGGSADTIQIVETGGAGSVKYDIFILGRSA